MISSTRLSINSSVLEMSWCEGSGGKMTLVKLLLSLMLLHTLSEASNQPPRFQNYFFQSYLLIYENTPVGE
ncbi:hypothetical protein QQF64_005328 [Cirrhinus molitorella]|uniref:Uncharacterized protein n=1 Tax=Cirrhinus molitorella TaxID=172907 RepID=A0ABR3MF26_9TELE